jgi:hypothetical protein
MTCLLNAWAMLLREVVVEEDNPCRDKPLTGLRQIEIQPGKVQAIEAKLQIQDRPHRGLQGTNQ